MQRSRRLRWLLGVGCCLCLLGVFLFQGVDIASAFGMQPRSLNSFLVNRSIRFILNDLLTIGLIYAIFFERKYVIFAVWTELIGLVLFLIPYFILKVKFPDYNGPLISFLHRLILNPTFLLLLIPAFYFQRHRATEEQSPN